MRLRHPADSSSGAATRRDACTIISLLAAPRRRVETGREPSSRIPMLTVVYPGTCDPFTRGHEDLVRRAASLFDHVVIGVAESASRQPFFTTSARVEMAREVLKPLANVVVKPFSGLLMDFVHAQKS